MTKITVDQKHLLQQIGIADFVVVDMVEYLDTHPYDAHAIEYFNHYMKIKNQLMDEYAKRYYPLTLATATGSKDEWKWALEPAPWEGGLY